VDRLLRAVNSRLPEDVQVVRAEVVREGFDPIGDCVAKGYSYTFWAGMHRPLWERRYVWHTWAALDIGAMRRAAAAFVGEHDFAAFAAAGHGRMSTVREVYACAVVEEEETKRRRDEETKREEMHGWDSRATRAAEAEAGRIIRLDISGNGFLYNMVRIIAGTLHEVGRGRIDAGAVPEIIANGDRRRSGPTLPPQGLCLEWIRYAEPSEPRA
jgi:tRNA pseudouridine38-40 synthase